MFALKLLFVFIGILYVISVILHKLYFSRLKDNVKISNYVALIAFFLFLYIILGLILVVFEDKLLYKIIILSFSLAPFMIGKVATYEKEKLYTIMQFILIIISDIFVMLI